MNNELISMFITWNPNPEIITLGSITLRWYSTCWLIGLLAGYFIVKKLYRDYKRPPQDYDPLFLHMFFGVLIGARLGHCLFYQPDYFLASGEHFIEMIVPIHHFADGSWHFTGYEGLSSHGGVFGMFIAFWLYCRRYKYTYLYVLDNVAVAAPFVGMMIRTGNLMNSEIVGNVTNVPWAFIFENLDMLPRHPAQLYEALFYALVGIVGIVLYHRTRLRHTLGSGFFFGYCVGTIFTFRFFVEFLKEVQEDFEQGMMLDMGQILSIPLAIIGIAFMLRALWHKKDKA